VPNRLKRDILDITGREGKFDIPKTIISLLNSKLSAFQIPKRIRNVESIDFENRNS